MKISVGIMLLAILSLAGPVSAEDLGQDYTELVLKASEWFAEDEPADYSELIARFEKGSRNLDSLTHMYMPLDTLSGPIGHERVMRIAQAYTDLGMNKKGLKWWKLLRRIDDREYFRLDNYRGLLRTGIAMGEVTLIESMLGGVELWDSSIKQELAGELLDALKFLYYRDADPKWLQKIFLRLKRFLPPYEAGLLYSAILLSTGDQEGAFLACRTMIKKDYAWEMTPGQARKVIVEMYRTSILSGKYPAAQDLLRRLNMYGSRELVAQARMWQPGLVLLSGDLDKARVLYAEICGADPTAVEACFWKDYIERYKETLANAQ
ncbi:MAG: hypothetical protein JXB45_09045 [Candidatus Krumholzibacteriota bacterium]|nr:hypothetical protein [Candidatus Krumholzibacteriota bacterium]